MLGTTDPILIDSLVLELQKQIICFMFYNKIILAHPKYLLPSSYINWFLCSEHTWKVSLHKNRLTACDFMPVITYEFYVEFWLNSDPVSAAMYIICHSK